MNIVLIVMDTLRYDYIGANGNNWIRTPNMDRLASEAWVFDRCLIGSFPTIPHRTDVITGRYGGPFHVWKPLPHDTPTLPRALADAGYRTQLIHDTPHLVNGGHNFDWPFHAWTFIRGAEVDRPWVDSLALPPDGWPRDPAFDFMGDVDWDGEPCYPLYMAYFRANRERIRYEDWNAARLFLTASRWLRDNSSREGFFLWLDSFDPHEPWDAPPEFVKMYDKDPDYDGRIDPRSFWVYRGPQKPTQEAEQRMRSFYAAKVSWVDRWLGEFLNTLDETGLSKNTTVMLTADHGTNVGERSIFGKQIPVREQEARVPLIIRTPDGDKGRSGAISQPQDIYATIVAQAGVGIPSELDGQDVLTLAREGQPGRREVALSGAAAGKGWHEDPNKGLFTVFDADWYLELGLKPEQSRLTRIGTLEDVAQDNPKVVADLHAKGLREIERRGIDPALLAWIKTQGRSGFPQDCRLWDGWPGPAGYEVYFRHAYFKR